WIDTCCIDKSSSAELTEAINSMFGYYKNAAVCYAFLKDLPATTPARKGCLDAAGLHQAERFRNCWLRQPSSSVARNVIIEDPIPDTRYACIF
ncbi:hypothetical protein L207DRAFT_441759, partial [Hyaloscypha variabilis F]